MSLSAIYAVVHCSQGSHRGVAAILSGTAEYALRAVVYVARHRDGGPVRASELAEATHVPRNYLGKILHELVRAGVLKSSRGKNGGFQLGVPPHRLSLLQIVSRFDKLGEQRRCLLGRPECSDRDPCPVHHRWRETAERIAVFFKETKIADLLD